MNGGKRRKAVDGGIAACRAQESNVFQCQAEARPQLSIREVEEPHADALLDTVIQRTNESANEA
jgi:hypothetical protein